MDDLGRLCVARVGHVYADHGHAGPVKALDAFVGSGRGPDGADDLGLASRRAHTIVARDQ